MAVGVGVVVSAFRLTPFFCRKVGGGCHSGSIPSNALSSQVPPLPALLPWQGAEKEELLIQRGVGAQQNVGT